jgi:hypothetical protein
MAVGRRYFVAILATDTAGLRSAATSNGVWIWGERGAQPEPGAEQPFR